MKKADILQSYKLDKMDSSTVFIQNNHFNFSYTIADSVVKDEHKGQYRYFGGLQSNFKKDSEKYKNLEKWLCELAEQALNIKPNKL